MSYRVELGLLLLVVVVLGVAVWAANRGPAAPSFDLRASTFLSGPQGSKALHEVLVGLGRVPLRRRTPLFDLVKGPPRPPALLAVLAPPLGLESAELDQVVAFVRAGGAVVAAGSGGGITACAGWTSDWPERAFPVDSEAVVPPRPGLRLPPVGEVLRPLTAERDKVAFKRRLESEEGAHCERLAALQADTLLATAAGRPVLLRLDYRGGGSVTLLSDPDYVRNRTWRDTDVPYVMLPVLTPRSRGRLVWDEYHQGFGRGTSLSGAVWGWLTGNPGGWAVLQLAAVALVWLAVTAVRFGPARAAIDLRRRSPLEHLEALAAGLETAAASDTAVRLVVSGLRRRLSRTGRLTPDARPLGPWLASLEVVLTTPRGRDAIRRLQRIGNQRAGPERVLAAAQAVEDVWEELRPRRTPGAF